MSSNITERQLETTALIDYYDGMAVLSCPAGLPRGFSGAIRVPR